MDLSTRVFSLYKHIMIYSLLAIFCDSSQNDSEPFSFARGFSCKGFYINLVFFFYFVFLYCVIDQNKHDGGELDIYMEP